MQQFFKILAYFVTIIYFLLGIYLLFQEKLKIIVDTRYSTIFGICLILYSIYRGFTIYRKYKEEINDEQEN